MLVDTSGFLCLFDKSESRHAEAAKQYDADAEHLTHNYVLAEFIPLCQRQGLNRAAALMFASDLVDSPEVEVVWVDQILHEAALALLRNRIDKTYSLCDAVSFLLMRKRGIMQALTTDRHFQQEGFIRLLI
jgi:predicted nucleic acid-binding protein